MRNLPLNKSNPTSCKVQWLAGLVLWLHFIMHQIRALMKSWLPLMMQWQHTHLLLHCKMALSTPLSDWLIHSYSASTSFRSNAINNFWSPKQISKFLFNWLSPSHLTAQVSTPPTQLLKLLKKLLISLHYLLKPLLQMPPNQLPILAP